jgi:hypothetical protein
VATVLYTALIPLTVFSVIDDWPCPAGATVRLDPAKATTQALIAAGSIVPAGPDATDTATPANVVRGVPGLHVGVSN